MDIFIPNVPYNTNHTELRLFLKDTLKQSDILAFDILKLNHKNWAVLTVADARNALRFLRSHGGRVPRLPLVYRHVQLLFSKSNKQGQPDMLKVRVLAEKELAMRAKQSKMGDTAKGSQPTKPNFSLIGFQSGIWGYDEAKQLIFDSKFEDCRQGTLTFGRSVLVVYLAAATHGEYDWNCRIDIPYGIVEHAIPSCDGNKGNITLTLRGPPKIYRIESTNDLHLYQGGEPSIESAIDSTLMVAFNNITLGPQTKRLVRECSIAQSYPKTSALCMVYRFTLPDVASAQRAWIHVSQSSALPQAQCWRTTIPSRLAEKVEVEFQQMEQELAIWQTKNAQCFNFAIRFQILALVLEGTLAPATMNQLIPYVKSLCVTYGPEATAHGVRKLQYQIPTPGPDMEAGEFGLSGILLKLTKNIKDPQKNKAAASDIVEKQNRHQHLVLTYKATVTPTGLLLRGPEYGISNRVLRKYSDKGEYFMRVFFADEDGASVLYDPKASQDRVYARFREVLKGGIAIAGRHYSFLGFSHSSLHNHTAWFMAPFHHDGELIYASHVIKDLGDFSHIHCSAKCAARIGQAFSDTIFAVSIPKTAVVTEDEPDMELNGRCFSDGCGTISRELLDKVWSSLPPDRRKLKPTVLQVRYRGAKGVLSLDTSLVGEQLRIRKSMMKYTAKQTWRDLEICSAAYKPLQMFLNHQFVKILEDLGVPQRNFLAVQHDAIKALEMIVRSPINAASFLEFSHSGVSAKVPNLVNIMHRIGIDFQTDRFLTDIVEIAAMSSLRDLKYRARIPVHQGHLLYGIMDETNQLEEGEVYIVTACKDEYGHWRRRTVMGDRLVVTRAPALHPGDVQVVKAVDVSQSSPLRDLYNCIVFSQQGVRDLPSQLSGGDLDGDLYHIIYDERLIPAATTTPSDYPPTEVNDLGRSVQVGDIVDFFIEYMNSDRLGQISNKHKIRADIRPLGTFDEDCITLAELASDAVDFSKSGKPVDMGRLPKGADRNRPDFMASGPGLIINNVGAAELYEQDAADVDDPDSIDVLDPEKAAIRYYRSDKTLGVLYRQIDETNFFSRMKSDFQEYQTTWGGESLIQKLKRYIDRETVALEWQHHRGFAEGLREYYCENLLEIMNSLRPHRGAPLTELEVFSGNILGKKERASTRYLREANIQVRERFDRDVGSIVRRIVNGDGLDDREEEGLPRAIACWMIALEEKGWEDYAGLKSWKYVVAAVCLEQLERYVNYRLRPL